MTIQQLYRTDVVHPKALVLNFTSDLLADMFVPIADFLGQHGVRIKSITTEGTKLTFSYYSGDRPIEVNLNQAGDGSTYYLLFEGLNLSVINECDLGKTVFSLIPPYYGFITKLEEQK